MSIKQLAKDDLTKLDLSELIYNSRTIKEFWEVLFPIVCSVEALKDDNFKRGYEYLVQIKNALIDNMTISNELIDNFYNEFLLFLKSVFLNDIIISIT